MVVWDPRAAAWHGAQHAALVFEPPGALPSGALPSAPPRGALRAGRVLTQSERGECDGRRDLHVNECVRCTGISTVLNPTSSIISVRLQCVVVSSHVKH